MADIDERIVEMKFNNQQFEAGTKQSLSTLDKLKQGLHLDAAAKSLQGLQDVADKFHLGGIADGVETLVGKFGALGIAGITAITNITNRAVNAGIALGKSLTIDPIKQGFGEYETQMKSIQTIMANTQRYGTKLPEVEKNLNELNTYADKTIYNFSEMTSNLSLFTNSGMRVGKATSVIKGFSNVAAASGTNAENAARAAYQLSQAFNSGTIRLMDWRSLTNAGMGNKNMQEGLLRVAETMGTVEKAGTSADKIQGNFNASLEKGWLSADVMSNYLKIMAGDMTKAQQKALGLTNAEIKQFAVEQKIAEDSATKVRTFTQLIGTVRESVGSGWANTARYVIGDFEEATTLFTNVNNVVSGIVSKMAHERNVVLRDWKKDGGRDTTILAISRAFQALQTVMGYVGKAAAQIFPQFTGKNLSDFSDVLNKIAFTMLGLARQYGPQIQRTFAGLFAVIDIGRFVLVELVKMLFSLFGELGPGSAGILDITANIGDFLVQLHDVIVNGEGVTKFFAVLGSILRVPIVLISRLIGFLGSLAAGLGDIRMAAFGEDSKKAGSKLTVLDRIMRSLDAATKAIKERFDKFKESLGPGFSKAGDVVGDFAENFATNLEHINWDTVLTAMKAGFFGSLTLLFTSFFGGGLVRSFKDLISGQSEMGLFARLFKGFDIGGGVFKSIKEGFEGVTGSLKAMQRNLQAKTLLSIALALGILTLSMVALSLIPAERLAGATAAMIVMFTELGVSMKIISGIASNKDVAKIPLLALGLILLAIAVSVLAGAVKKLADLDWNELARGLVGMTVILAAVVATSKLLGAKEQANIIRTGLAMIPFAVGIRIMASALNAMQGLDWMSVGTGLAGIGGILGAMILYSKLLAKNEGAVLKGAASLLIISVGLKILVSVLQDLASADPLKMGLALGFMAAALFAIAGSLRIMPKNMAISGIALLLIANALKIMSDVLKEFSGLSPEEIGKSLVVLGASLIIIAGALLLFEGALPGAAALLVAAAALAVMAPALKMMGEMDIEVIGKALGLLAASLIIIAGSLYLMTAALPGAAALLVAAAALTILGPALAVMGGIPIAAIGVALLALAGVFVVLGLGAVALAVLAPVLLLLGAAMLLIGVGAGAAGAGVFLLATGLVLLGGAGAAGIGVLTLAILGVLKLIPAIAKALADGFIAFVKGIADSAGSIIDAVVKIFDMILKAITKEVPKIIDLGVLLITEFLNAIEVLIPQVVDTGLKIVTGVLKGIADNLPGILKQATRIIVNFINGIADGLPKIIKAGANLLVKFINGIADAIDQNSERIGKAGGRVAGAMITGMVKGIAAGVGEIGKAVLGMGSAALDAIKLILGIHSPSKEFQKIGEYTVDGFVAGIKGKQQDVTDAFDSMRSQLKDFIDKSKTDIDDLTDKVADLKAQSTQDKKDVVEQKGVYNQALSDRRKGTSKTIREEKKKLADLTVTRKKDTRELKDAIAASKDGDATAKSRKNAQDRVEDLTRKRKQDTNAIKAQQKVLNAAIKDNKNGVIVEQEKLKLDKLRRGRTKTNKELTQTQTDLNNATDEGPKAEEALRLFDIEAAKHEQRLGEISVAVEDYDEKIKDAESSLDNAKSTLNDFNTSLRDQLNSLDTIGKDTNLTEYTTSLEDQITKVNEFATKIQDARNRGLSDDAYKKLLASGPDAIPFLDQLLAQGEGGVADLNSLFAQLLSASTSLAGTASESLYRSGVNTAQGYLDGLNSSRQSLIDESTNIANAITTAVNAALGIKSPSRVFRKIGQYTMQGFEQGIRETGISVQNAATDVADDTVTSLRDTMSNLGANISLGMDSAPVVRPVLDLTQIQRDAGQIGSLLGTPGVSVDSTFNSATAASNGYDSNQAAMMAVKGEVATTNTTVFNQTNNSPKALSNAEIYRQTNNQLSKLKRGDT